MSRSTVRRRLLAAAFLIVVLFGLVPGLPLPLGAQAGLFTPVPAQPDVPLTLEPFVLRSQPVSINFALLDAAPSPAGSPTGTATTLLLNLFPDVALTAYRERLEPTSSGLGFIWSGKVAGLDTSQVTLVVENGVMAGNIRVPGASYQVRATAGGGHVVRQIDERRFPDDLQLYPSALPASDPATAPQFVA
jgi:hypothetical protein